MFGWFKNSTSRRARRSVRTFRRQLQFDSLESRVLLAGDVRVALAGGELQITGDTSDNAIVVRGTKTPGEFIVSSADGTTTINGLTTPFTTPRGTVVTDLVISMGNGNDCVNLANASVRNHIRIDMGSDGGEDLGKDVVTVSYVRIGGTLDVPTGGGDDKVVLSALTVTGATTIDTGAGADVLTVSASKFGNTFDANTGGGDDKVVLSALTVTGATMIDTGAGADCLIVSACKFGNTFDAKTGGGNDVVTISAVQFVGACTIDTGGTDSGNDVVVISASRFQKSATVTLGDGDDKLVVTASRFDSTFLADGGGGIADALVNRFNRFRGSPTLINFERFPWV